MIVVTGIIAFITTIILAQYPELGSRFSLARIAREIALSMRQAQTYGLAVKEFPTQNDIYPPYGIYIRPVDGPENSFIIFGDYCTYNGGCSIGSEGYFGTGDGFFNIDKGLCGSGSGECLEELSLAHDVIVSDVCVLSSGGVRYCWSEGNLDELDVTFKRPDPEAHIKKNPYSQTDYNSAEIVISSAKVPDAKKVIRIWITGQISVQDYVETP